MKRNYSFLFKRGGHIVYAAALFGFMINGLLSVTHLRNGHWLLAMWSLGAIALLPKAILGLILLIGREEFIYINIPHIIHRVFPRTMSMYGEESLAPFIRNILLVGYVREITALLFALIPLLSYVIRKWYGR